MKKPPALLPGLILEPVTKLKRRVISPATASGRVAKGKRIERELAELHAAFGVIARRVPLSGALGKRLGPDFAGDLKIWIRGDAAPPLTAEVKGRADGTGFVVLEKWLGTCDLLILKRNRATPMVVLPWATWAALIRRDMP